MCIYQSTGPKEEWITINDIEFILKWQSVGTLCSSDIVIGWCWYCLAFLDGEGAKQRDTPVNVANVGGGAPSAYMTMRCLSSVHWKNEWWAFLVEMLPSNGAMEIRNKKKKIEWGTGKAAYGMGWVDCVHERRRQPEMARNDGEAWEVETRFGFVSFQSFETLHRSSRARDPYNKYTHKKYIHHDEQQIWSTGRIFRLFRSNLIFRAFSFYAMYSMYIGAPFAIVRCVCTSIAAQKRCWHKTLLLHE